MSKRIFIVAGFLGLMVGYHSCIDPYAAPGLASQGNYLVVDGFLNATENTCTVTLSKSLPLASTDGVTTVDDASVWLVDEDNNTVPLAFQKNGVYAASGLSLALQKKYGLEIKTQGGSSVYRSDLVPIATSAGIDSVGWNLDYRGTDIPNAQFYVDAHGTAAQSPYYLWKFEETWSYTARYPSFLKFVNGEVVFNLDTTYYCWKTVNSTAILITSTTKYSENRVSQFLLNTLSRNSVKFSRGYSLLVKQFGMTPEAYEYYQELKTNSENLGTIFAPQPSRISGNVHSVSNPSEPVFGYFMASGGVTKRIFVKPTDFPPVVGTVITGYESCGLDTLKVVDLPSYAGGSAFVSSYGIGPVGYLLTSVSCVDCRLQGGTIIKPDFWP
jgi:hypothetical protein